MNEWECLDRDDPNPEYVYHEKDYTGRIFRGRGRWFYSVFDENFQTVMAGHTTHLEKAMKIYGQALAP